MAAGLSILFGGAGGASASSLSLCTTTVAAPTASPTSAPAGTPVTYATTVTASAGCANGSPTGTVAFYSNYLVNGQPASFQIGNAVSLAPSATPGQSTATLVDSSLPAGAFAITASYTSNNESSFFDSGPSAGTSVVIQAANVTTPLMDFTLSPSSLVVGQDVTFHVHITPVDLSGNPTGGVATGVVHFSAGPALGSGQFAFATVQLDNTGSLTFHYGGFVAGDYIVVASYSGDPTDQSVAGQLPLHVTGPAAPIATATTVSASPSSIQTGGTTTLQAHVVETATQAAPPAGGTVNFYAGPSAASVQLEGSGTLDANGNAQLSGVGNFTSGAWVVRATYAGDATNNVAGSSGDNTLLVSAPALGAALATTTTYVGVGAGTTGSTVTVTGQLLDGQGHPIGGEPLTLAVGTQSCVTGPTVGANGQASCTITLSQPAGDVAATASFLGDASWAPSSGSGTFAIGAAPTSVVYNGATSAVWGSSATLSGTLTDGDGHPLAGRTVHFAAGTQSCDGVTDASGKASCSATITLTPNDYSVSASFAGDDTYAGSGVAVPFAVTGLTTTTTYTGATHGAQGATATLSAHVDNAPGGASVSFGVGSAACSGTVSGGVASCTVTLTDVPGPYTVTASYAGDDAHSASSDSKAFTIFAPTTTTQAGNVAPVLAGSSATLTATVTPSAATGTVTFSSGGTTLCVGTLSGGAASCTASFAQTGMVTVTAHYDGDGVFPASQATTTVLVYAFAPGGGSFVVGDRSASGTVTFWGDKWAKVNSLGGGAAPNAFKGFAVNGATCGGTWSTDPGNSAPPPGGSLPAYMAVLVTSKATKPGSQISGNVVAIVIVKTNAGYDSNPGHAGTGTVVATLCG